jgi:hypothetical protein
LFLLRKETEWGCSCAGLAHNNSVETVNEFTEYTKKELASRLGKDLTANSHVFLWGGT